MASNDDEVNLHSDTCNEVGHDPACDYCHPYSPMDVVNKCMDLFDLKQRMRCLASNLYQAAALCEAFDLGYRESQRDQFHGVNFSAAWRPGCQRPAP